MSQPHTWRLELRGIRDSRVKAVSAALFAHGATGVQEDFVEGTAPPLQQPWDDEPLGPTPTHRLLKAWFDVREPNVEAALSAWMDGCELRWVEEPWVDWEAVSQASFPPIQVGNLTVAPPWSAQPGDLVIDPGSGFGTGDHPTTRQALEHFQALDVEPAHALDIGCGSGVLAIAAVRAGWTAHGTDIDDAALENAQRNANLNQVTARFDRTTPDQLEPATLVFANLHAELLVRFSDDLVRLTSGHLITAGILAERESKVLRALSALTIADRRVDGEWVSIRFVPGDS